MPQWSSSVGLYHDTCCVLVPQQLCFDRVHVALCGFSSLPVIQHCHGGAVPVYQSLGLTRRQPLCVTPAWCFADLPPVRQASQGVWQILQIF